MFDFSRKKQPAFGNVAADDDSDIEIQQVKSVSRQGIWIESFKLFRDIILVVSVFILLMVFVAQPVVVKLREHRSPFNDNGLRDKNHQQNKN